MKIKKEHAEFMKAFDQDPGGDERHTDYGRFIYFDEKDDNCDDFVRQYVTHDAESGKWTGVATRDFPNGFDEKIYDVEGEFDTPQEVVAVHDREFAKWQPTWARGHQ